MISYELAKRLKDTPSKWVSFKECKDCHKTYLGGHKSYRCKPCQKVVRKTSNLKWQDTYYQRNKERILKQQVILQRTKRISSPYWREQEKTKAHKRRALLEGNGGTHTTTEWLELVERNEKKCVNCKQEKPLTRDHIIPLSRGGTNDIGNIQPLCGSCNSSKGNRI